MKRGNTGFDTRKPKDIRSDKPEPHNGYDGYDDYLDAVTFDYTDDLFESDRDYDQEIDVPDYERV